MIFEIISINLKIQFWKLYWNFLQLWQQLIQQSTNMKPLQQQQQLPQTISQSVNLQRTAVANTLLAATSASTNVRPAVADHLSGQSNAEQQQQQRKQLIASATVSSTIPTNMSGRVATGSTEAERASMQPLSSTTSQLYNDFRNAEQMRKELDESVRQLEAQQKLVKYFFACLLLAQYLDSDNPFIVKIGETNI